MGQHRKTAISSTEAVRLITTEDRTTLNEKPINGVKCNVLLITAAQNDKKRLDLRRDGCGVWIQKNTKSAIPISINTESIMKSKGDLYMWRTTFSCKSYPGLKKTEIYMRRNNAGVCSIFICPNYTRTCRLQLLK